MEFKPQPLFHQYRAVTRKQFAYQRINGGRMLTSKCQGVQWGLIFMGRYIINEKFAVTYRYVHIAPLTEKPEWWHDTVVQSWQCSSNQCMCFCFYFTHGFYFVVMTEQWRITLESNPNSCHPSGLFFSCGKRMFQRLFPVDIVWFLVKCTLHTQGGFSMRWKGLLLCGHSTLTSSRAAGI